MLQITPDQKAKLKILGVHSDNIYEIFEHFEKSDSFFVDRKTWTSVNEILGFEFHLRSWQFAPIFIGEFMDSNEGQLKSLDKILELKQV